MLGFSSRSAKKVTDPARMRLILTATARKQPLSWKRLVTLPLDEVTISLQYEAEPRSHCLMALAVVTQDAGARMLPVYAPRRDYVN